MPASSIFCLPILPARHLCLIIRIGCPGIDHVARADCVQQLLRVAGVRRVLRGIEMVEPAKILIEPVDSGQVFVQIAQVIFPELTGCVALIPEDGSDRGRKVRHADIRPSLTDGSQTSADRELASDERRPSRCATRFP